MDGDPREYLAGELEKLQDARSQVKKLEDLQRSQEAQIELLQAELAELESSRGERVLDDLLSGDAAQALKATSKAVAEKRAEVETCQAVLRALSPRLEAARRNVVECKARALSLAGVVLLDEAKARQPVTDELLRKLEEWEDCVYEPRKPDTNPLMMTPRDGGAVTVIPAKKPITQLLNLKAGYYFRTSQRLLAGLPPEHDLVTGRLLFDLPEWINE